MIIQEIRVATIPANLTLSSRQTHGIKISLLLEKHLAHFFGYHTYKNFLFTDLIEFMDHSQNKVCLWSTCMGQQEMV